MSVLSTTEPTIMPLSASQIEDLKLASSKMSGAERRSFQAAMTLKYCRGNARQAERVLGWNRDTVELGLHEQRTGITCLGAQAACCGTRLWEEKYPVVAEALWALAESHCQQDPTFRGTLSYTRLTAAEALQQLRAQGFPEDDLPSPSTMAEVLNRNGYRLRQVVKAKPKKTPGNGRHLCQPGGKGRETHNGCDGRRGGADHAPEHRLQSHREYRGLLTGRKNPRQYPSGRPRYGL